MTACVWMRAGVSEQKVQRRAQIACACQTTTLRFRTRQGLPADTKSSVRVELATERQPQKHALARQQGALVITSGCLALILTRPSAA